MIVRKNQKYLDVINERIQKWGGFFCVDVKK